MSAILIVDDDVAGSRTLELYLRSRGYETAIAADVDQALARVAEIAPDLVIMDIRMPGRSGLEGLAEIKASHPAVPVIMITAFHDMESTIDAMQKGALDYIHKPIDTEELDQAITKALERGGETIAVSSAQLAGTDSMVGCSRAMKEVFKTIGLVAGSPANVLITGESGTGKELVARAIHRAGPSADGPFVVVNCAALVETLLESDMFGHERGAFTGAVTRQLGKLALARGGTILLDEIGELSALMQAKLLRVLQYKEFVPLGGQRAETTDARIIAATNADLAEKLRAGEFREDLYFRLQVVNIHLPPLRERPEDLPDLVRVLLGRIGRDTGAGIIHLAEDAMACLRSHHWPGNVRELENRLLEAAALSPGKVLTCDLFPDLCPSDAAAPAAATREEPGSPLAPLSLAEMERIHVARVLAACSWHRGQACELLGISRPRLRRIMREYGLEPPAAAARDDPDRE